MNYPQQGYPPQQYGQPAPNQWAQPPAPQQAPPQPVQQDGGDFDLGGGGGVSFSFGPQGAQPGAVVSGVVVDMKEVQATSYETRKPEFWDDGSPKMQYRVTLQTDLRNPAEANDNGRRDVYLDGRRRANDNGTMSKLCAVLTAVKQVTGGTSLQRGGKLTLQWVSGMGFSGDPRNYQAWYEAPAMQLGAPPAAPAPQQAPPVQQAPVQQPYAASPPPPAQPQWAAPSAPQQAAQQAPPVQQQPAAGSIQPGPGQPATQLPAGGPTPEAIAALQAAGVDPAAVYPGYAQ